MCRVFSAWTLGFVVLASGWLFAGEEIDPRLRSLEWREVGPYRGGRCAAVTGLPQDPLVYYFGATGGGVWKTSDAGVSWKNVSDGFFGGSIGAVAVSEWDPNVIYVGGGEKTVRGNVSHGDGMWKSTDAGRTWKSIGLLDSRHVSRIRVHPKDPDLVYAAVMGHLFGPNDERGIYRSKDGGETWERILFVDPAVGAVDLAMDPTNPRILYASFWRILRTPSTLESGGEGSGIWKSTDGGDEWEEITAHEGLPEPPVGICGITVSRTNPDNVYAIVEAAEGGVFRSRDAGKTWKRTSASRDLRQRAWYYSRIYADPADEDTVYVLNVRFHRSKDGGKTFTTISTPHSDNHDLWIDPVNPQRMIEGNDGGANITFDGGETWSRQDNQPTAQMYRVSTDNGFPYRLLGGQQDNSAIRIRSRSLENSAIGRRDWDPTAGGESGHIVARPDDPDVVFGGSYGGYLTLFDHRTGQRRAVNVWPDNPMGWGAADLKYRFQWNFPIFFSPHDPSVLYAAANVLFRSANGGASWKPISPDLTRNDKTKQGSSGGPITKDNTSVEYYCTIFSAAESPHERGTIWAGSDDGVLHLTRDGGLSWRNVTPPDLPEWSQVNGLEVHPFDKGGLYLAATRYKLDDFEPYLYRTRDYGQTWTRIDRGIDRSHFTRAIRADSVERGLLFAGTERGVYFSRDDGANWASLQLKLPVVPITDLALKEGDLVAATQGRGYWILDDLSPLRQLDAAVAAKPLHLFEPRAAVRVPMRRSDSPRGQGTNPAPGVWVSYWLAEEPAEDQALELEISTENGQTVRTFTRKPKKPEKKPEGDSGDDDSGDEDSDDEDRQLTAEAGLNRFAWDLRHPGAERFPKMILWNSRLQGPRAVPGEYRARITCGDLTEEVRFRILPDPRSSTSQADLEAQLSFLLGVRDKLTETHRELRRVRSVRKQLEQLVAAADERDDLADFSARVKAFQESMETIEKRLYQTQNESRQDPLNFPIRLNDKLAGLLSLVGRGDHAPTQQAEGVRLEISSAIDGELSKLRQLWTEELPEINRAARDAEIPAVRLSESDSEKAEKSGAD